MSMTANNLTRAAAVCAVAAGALFIGVQVGHPKLNVTSLQTTEVYIRDQLKILMAILALVGITGMYLSQISKNGILGLIGYALLAAGYLFIMAGVVYTAYVLPEVATSSPNFVHDVIVADTGRGTMKGEIGALETVIQLRGFAYLLGGLLFGIALYRANVLARWAAALLAVGGVVSVALSLMPDAFYRLLAFPNGIAMIGLGYSMWRVAGASTTKEPSADTARASTEPPASNGSTHTKGAASVGQPK